MNEKADAIARIRGAFKELQQAVRDLPDEQMNEVWYGEWCTKDLLAHIASWDEFAAQDLRRVGRGHVPCLAAFRPAEINQWNEFFMKTRRRWPLVQVRFESSHSHDEFMDALNSLPESMFGQGHLVASYCNIAGEHYAEHTKNVMEHHYPTPVRKEPDRWAGTNSSPN